MAPDGAVIKQTAASPHLLRHRGKAVVFERYEELRARIDDPDLAIDENSVLVLKNAGREADGVPGVGPFADSRQAAEGGGAGHRPRFDARMSGTSFGTDVLHISPESAAGGPLAAVRTGDEIELNVPERRIDLRIEENAIKRRIEAAPPRPPRYRRGYGKLFLEQVTQAHEGCDFRFLRKDA